jgi:hypothetical protein
MMDIKANVASSYQWRLGIMAVICVLFGFYSMYDAMVAYPLQREVAMKYQGLVERNLDQKEWQPEWEAFAQSKGWPPDELPGEPYSDFDIKTQYLMMILTLPAGVWYVVQFVLMWGQWIACTDAGLTTRRGKNAPFKEIVRFDTNRWKSKGMAVVHYRSGTATDKIVLDDTKYSRVEIEQMVLELRARINPDKNSEAVSAQTGKG